jgi:hypothetical protein
LIVLAVVYVIFSIGRHALWGDQYGRKWAENVLNILSERWKGLVLLLIPMFYRPVRIFLEKVKKAWGLETEKMESDEENRGQ